MSMSHVTYTEQSSRHLHVPTLSLSRSLSLSLIHTHAHVHAHSHTHSHTHMRRTHTHKLTHTHTHTQSARHPHVPPPPSRPPASSWSLLQQLHICRTGHIHTCAIAVGTCLTLSRDTTHLYVSRDVFIRTYSFMNESRHTHTKDECDNDMDFQEVLWLKLPGSNEQLTLPLFQSQQLSTWYRCLFKIYRSLYLIYTGSYQKKGSCDCFSCSCSSLDIGLFSKYIGLFSCDILAVIKKQINLWLPVYIKKKWPIHCEKRPINFEKRPIYDQERSTCQHQVSGMGWLRLVGSSKS